MNSSNIHRDTSYKKEWQMLFPWIRSVENDKSKAHCGICRKDFQINSSGKSQVTAHSKTKGHLELSQGQNALAKFLSNSQASVQEGNILI